RPRGLDGPDRQTTPSRGRRSRSRPGAADTIISGGPGERRADRRNMPRKPKAAGDRPYPRDMTGYGRTPPDPRWPGGARVAVQFVINYEEGGDSTVRHDDTQSADLLTTQGGTP